MPKSKRVYKIRRKPVGYLINLKVTEREQRMLRLAARKYANGNLSEWLRFAGATFKPGRYKLSA